MHRIVRIIVILLLFSSNLPAQDVPNFMQVDTETYKFYEAGTALLSLEKLPWTIALTISTSG